MLRPLAVLVMAAFVATAAPALADPGYTANTLPTLSVFNRTGTTVKVEFLENGVVKGTVTLYKTTSYVPVTLRGTFTMVGTVDVNGKNVAIASRGGVALVAGTSFNVSVEPNGAGGFIFKNGP